MYPTTTVTIRNRAEMKARWGLGLAADTLTKATEINRMGIAYDPASPIRPKKESGLGPVNGWAMTVIAICRIIQLTSGAANIVEAVMAATERGC
jgi:hypothetical protein